MIELNTKELCTSVSVPAEFIRTYLPASPGEYVKVYLYLLMLSEKREGGITTQALAKDLCCTVDDVMESLRFWKKQGVLELDIRNEQIRGIRFKKIEEKRTAGNRSAENIRSIRRENKEAAQLLFVAEQYLKRPLSRNDMNVLLFFLEDLKLPLDLCEFVVEYCVLKGHSNIRYIEKVGISWHEKGIASVKEAREQNGMWNKYHYEVLKAFGIHGRDPVTQEVKFIEKWRREYGFSMPVISEACSRTIANTGKSSFEYADRILTNWHEGQVSDLKDIEKLDKKYKEQKTRSTGRADGRRYEAVSSGTNVSHKEYDFKKIADDKKRKDAAYRAYPRLSEIDREVSELSMRKARINLGISDADDFDLEKRLKALSEERRALLINAGYTSEEIADEQ